jgi:hypothetical protein
LARGYGLLSLLPTRCLKNFASKAKVRHLPTNYDWAYEMQVEDLDGNAFRFGSGQKPASPSWNGWTCAAIARLGPQQTNACASKR